MSRRSGSEVHSHSYVFAIQDTSQVGESRRFASVICEDLGFGEVRQGRISIIINELGNNLFKYAANGKLVLRRICWDGRTGLEILSIDNGPGIENVGQSLEDGFSTGDTPGTGLGAVQRLADIFDIFSIKGQGTVIVSVVFSEEWVRSHSRSLYAFSAISVPVKGEFLCGDAWSVREYETGLSVIVADGLGHGPHANTAATQAVEVFTSEENPTLDRMLNVIHGSLRSTRGAAVFALKVNKKSDVEFCGAGNIRAVIQMPEKARGLMSQNGTAGVQMRTVRVSTQNWDGSGYLILHTDGISSRWDLSEYPGLQQKHPALLAGIIYRDFLREKDDATVVVIGRRQ